MFMIMKLTLPQTETFYVWKMGSGKETEIMVEKDEWIMLNGFSWHSPKILINQNLMLFYLKFYLHKKMWNDVSGLTFLEADVGWVDAESDVEGRSHASWKSN